MFQDTRGVKQGGNVVLVPWETYLEMMRFTGRKFILGMLWGRVEVRKGEKRQRENLNINAEAASPSEKRSVGEAALCLRELSMCSGSQPASIQCF